MATYSEHVHYIIKWRIRHTHSITRCTYPPLCNYRDNAKIACHGPARYKRNWIYTQTKMRGQLRQSWVSPGNEREKERLTNGLFFEHLVLTCTIVLMNDLGLVRCTICWRFWFSCLEISQNYLFWDIWVFIMYCIIRISRPSLLIESTNSMICNRKVGSGLKGTRVVDGKQYSSGSRQVSIVSVETPFGRLEIQAHYRVALIFRKWNPRSCYRPKKTAAMAHLSMC